MGDAPLTGNSLQIAVHGSPNSTKTKLVSNTGQTDDATASFENDHAQAFTTGSHPAGYTLDRVDMEITSSGTVPTYDVSIRTDSSSAPDTNTTHCSLANPTSLSDIPTLVQFTASSCSLDASTTYWVMINVTGSQSSTTTAKRTSATAEDASSEAGWEIADSRLHRTWNTSAWNTATANRLQIALHGSEKTSSDTTAPTFQSATLDITVDGASNFKVTFNENLDSNFLPTANAFTLSSGQTSMSTVFISDATVTIILTSPPPYGVPVTVSYTPPTSDPLQDLAGNPVAAFSGKTVTVNDSRTPPDSGGGNNPIGGGNNPGGGGGGGSRPRDDHGNSATTATRIAPSGRTAGQLNTRSDVDYFTLTAPQAGVVVIETSGSTDTRATVWQNGAVLARADSGGAGQNFRLSARVAAGEPVVLAVRGNGRQTGRYVVQTALVLGHLENPAPASFQSGLGLLSGWVCDAEGVTIEIEQADGTVVELEAAYGTERADTAAICGDADNGFGLLFNWNLLGDGAHAVRVLVHGVPLGVRLVPGVGVVPAVVDGIELGRAPVTVTTLGEEFRRGLTGRFVVADFPRAGENAHLVWQESQQNFVLAPAELGTAVAPGPGAGGIEGVLENPAPASYQSGVGVISGWVCEADEVVIELDGQPIAAAAGTERADTADLCGDTDNGFGLLVNWAEFGAGEHEVVALVDGMELSRATVTVTVVDATETFVRGLAKRAALAGFPTPEETVTVEWQESQQNFVITGRD